MKKISLFLCSVLLLGARGVQGQASWEGEKEFGLTDDDLIVSNDVDQNKKDIGPVKVDKKIYKSKKINKSREQKRIEYLEKERRENEQKKIKDEQTKAKNEALAREDRAKYLAKKESVKSQRHQAKDLMEKWKDLHTLEVERDYDSGKYADLVKLPSWPTHSWFFSNQNLLNVNLHGSYAAEFYGVKGGNNNITASVFGEGPICIDDICLLSKLIRGKTDAQVGYDVAGAGGHHGTFLNFRSEDDRSKFKIFTEGNGQIWFNGKKHYHDLTFDYSRYLVGRDIAIGVSIPVVYRKHDISYDYINSRSDVDTTSGKRIYTTSTANNVIQNVVTREFITTLLREKGFNELGGSASGFGDVSFYSNVQINSHVIDKFVTGVKVQLPTGKKAKNDHLWGPALGNGGFTELSAYVAMSTSYKRCFNPHAFIQGTFCAPAHVDRRVPKKVSVTANSDTFYLKDYMSLGDWVALTNGQKIETFDTTIKGFGDTVTRLVMEKGPEIELKVGNVIEKFILRRGFLDIFYDLKVKFKDSARELNIQDWDLDVLTKNTQGIAHNIGAEYTHQFDNDTRFKMGVMYTFAGMNMPKTVEGNISFGYSF